MQRLAGAAARIREPVSTRGRAPRAGSGATVSPVNTRSACGIATATVSSDNTKKKTTEPDSRGLVDLSGMDITDMDDAAVEDLLAEALAEAQQAKPRPAPTGGAEADDDDVEEISFGSVEGLDSSPDDASSYDTWRACRRSTPSPTTSRSTAWPPSLRAA